MANFVQCLQLSGKITGLRLTVTSASGLYRGHKNFICSAVAFIGIVLALHCKRLTDNRQIEFFGSNGQQCLADRQSENNKS